MLATFDILWTPHSCRLLVTAALVFYASGSYPVSGISHSVSTHTVTSSLVMQINTFIGLLSPIDPILS